MLKSIKQEANRFRLMNNQKLSTLIINLKALHNERSQQLALIAESILSSRLEEAK